MDNIHLKECGVITHPRPIFNGGLVKSPPGWIITSNRNECIYLYMP